MLQVRRELRQQAKQTPPDGTAAMDAANAAYYAALARVSTKNA
jgi:hypothetical protein